MDFLNLYFDYSWYTIVSLATLSLIAGFIDSIIGGGGLIQIPSLIINLPNLSLPTLLGTSKISGLSGGLVASYQYSKKTKLDYSLLFTITLFAIIASYFGANIITRIGFDFLKPVILILLFIIALYTLFTKDFGSKKLKKLSKNKQLLFGALIGFFVGFYSGLLGPGTGSLFLVCFVIILGFEFIVAAAYTKIINCFTNITALYVFIHQGHFLIEIAILISITNVIGSYLGSKMALKNGNKFIRMFFLIIVLIMIIKYCNDFYLLYFKN